MILLFGAMTDSVMGFLVARMLEREVHFLFLDPRNHGDGFHMGWSVEPHGCDGRLHFAGRTYPLSDIRSAYVRELSTLRPEGQKQGTYDDGATCWLLNCFLETAPILVVNRAFASMTNMSKPYQTQRIARAGFPVPRTLVTNCPDEARAFYEGCGRRAIFKSTSGIRSIVVRMKDDDLERLDRLRGCPTQFQEWIPGTDVRVHVMGERLFATEVTTDAVDYRYAGRDGHERTMRAVELPPDIARRCRDTAAALGLVSAGIDLRRTPDGEYYCFEANPTPGFTFYQQYTGQRIGDALVDLLLTGAPN
jgi:glutathione synthase/RimK-type ligase-like ATP-grasp enzyme